MSIPLSESLRPKSFDEVVGQDHLTGTHGLLTKIIQKGYPLSILLWGPPGCGKTTIARLYAKAFNSEPITFSAATSGIADIKKMIADIGKNPLFNQKPLLFVDEIHRFNKAQQDLFLPYLENGTFILIGATTENPSFALNNALLSRLRVLDLKSLTNDALFEIIAQFERKEPNLTLTPEAKETIVELSQGDGRHLINTLENLDTLHEGPLDLSTLSQLLQKRPPLYDRDGDGHYNLISALHKSIRGSDPDAALYWLTRMLEGGEDREYILRRLTRIASEDIGLADPNALSYLISAWDTYKRLGSPEGELTIAQAVIYLALAPKSNATYLAFKEATQLATSTSQLNPPKTILNAPTTLMKEKGYGKDYAYDHNAPEAFSGQDYFPEELSRTRFYHPNLRGFEGEMKKRLNYFEKLRATHS